MRFKNVIKKRFKKLFEAFDPEYERVADDDYTGAYLEQSTTKDKDRYIYKMYNNFDKPIKTWRSALNSLDMPLSYFRQSINYHIFMKEVGRLAKKIEKDYGGAPYVPYVPYGSDDSLYNDNDFGYSGRAYSHLFDDDEDDISPSPVIYKSYYTSKPKSTGFLDKLNKSDTLVIHCQDSTTDMLSQIYEGKGWDVLRDGNIDKDELHQLIDSHDRIVMLGHGTPSGLFNKQGSGFVIGDEEAPLLRGKKLFAIWCYASDYGKRNGLHGFWTGNMPSDNHEAAWVGYHVSPQYMLDNITYWSKCCADVVEQALNGDAKGAAEKAREAYLEVYGDESRWNEEELGITKYNADRTTAI